MSLRRTSKTLALFTFFIFLVSNILGACVPCHAANSESKIIEEKYPEPGEKNVSVGSKVKIRFSSSIDKENLEDNIKIYQNDAETVTKLVYGKVNYKEENNEVTFEPKDKLEYGTKYKVTIKKELGLEKDENWSFTTKAHQSSSGGKDSSSDSEKTPEKEHKRQLDLKNVKLIEKGKITRKITTGAKNISLNPSFKINFSHGVYLDKENNFSCIYLYDLDSKKKVAAKLNLAKPGAYNDFFDSKEKQHSGDIEKSRSIVIKPSKDLKKSCKYRLFIGKKVAANNTAELNKDIKIDFTTIGEGSSSSGSSSSSKSSGKIITEGNHGVVVSSEKENYINFDITKVVEKNNAKTVNISQEAIKTLKEKKKYLVLEDLEKTIIIPNEAFQETKDINFTIKNLEKLNIGKKIKNKEMFEIDINSEQNDSYEFEKKITIKIPVNKNIKNTKRVVVYQFKKQKNKWEYLKNEIKDGNIILKTNGPGKYLIGESTKTFVDINNHWAKDVIYNMADREITNGIDEGHFAPDSQITRAEIISLLSKGLDLREKENISTFKDVDQKSWYADSMAKAVKAGIVKGYNNTLRPNDYITREEIACMIASAYRYKGKKVDNLESLKFIDQDNISSWAKESVQEVYSLDIVNGNPDRSFGPKNYATRAEGIVILKNLLEKIN